MDTRTLQIFKAVVDAGTVSKAAESLNYVQSNVTARVRRLEEELGAQLFYRSRQGMTLTPAGEVLLGYADQALHVIDTAHRAMAEMAGTESPLRLGSMESTLAARLPAVLAELRRQRPKIRLDIVSGPTDDLVEALLAHRLDAALVGGRIHHPDILQEVAFTEEIVLVTDTGVVDLAQVENRLLLVFKQGCSYRALAEQWLRTSGLAPVDISELGTLDGILGCVAAGVGMTLMPKSVVDRPQYKDLLKVVSIGETGMMIDTMLIRHKEAAPNRTLDKFLEILRKYPKEAGKRTANPT